MRFILIPFAALLGAACSVREAPAMPTPITTALPPIDAEAPAAVRTATFALG